MLRARVLSLKRQWVRCEILRVNQGVVRSISNPKPKVWNIIVRLEEGLGSKLRVLRVNSKS